METQVQDLLYQPIRDLVLARGWFPPYPNIVYLKILSADIKFQHVEGKQSTSFEKVRTAIVRLE